MIKKQKLVLLLPISIILLTMGKYIPGFAEHIYAASIYKWLSQGMAFLTGWIPFSIMELEIVLIPIIVITAVVICITKLMKQKNRRKTIMIKAFWNVVSAISVVLFLFVITCGINYYRDSFTEYSGLEVREYTKEELQGLCISLTEKANELRVQMAEDENGITQFLSLDDRKMSQAAAKAMQNLSKIYPILEGTYPGTKKMFFSKIMSRLELTGIFWGFTMEANVNTDVPAYTIPATMCHELSHLRGFMREDEANYLGYLACANSDSIELQYSGMMMALVYAGNQLYKTDKELYQEVRAHYNDGVLRDLKADSDYWEPYENTAVSQVSSKMNDTYLKANNQTDGVKSYGKMVDLLLAEYVQDF